MEGEEHLEIYGRLGEEIAMKPYLYGPMDYAKTLKLQSLVGNLDLPDSRKRYTGSREEEEDAQMCPCGKQKGVEPTLWENMKCPRRNGMCWRRCGKQTNVIWAILVH